MSRSLLIRIALLLLIILFIAQQIRSQHSMGKTDSGLAFGRTGLPLGGVPDNDTHGTVPGNPDKTMTDGANLFAKVQIYRSHHKSYPASGNGFLLDMWNNPTEYGYANGKAAHTAFTNPDSKYSDIAMLRESPDAAIPWVILDNRPDGSPVGSSKRDGSMDVVAYTPLYYHEEIRHFNGSKDTIQPVGFYIVVWENGLVQQVPYSSARYVQVPGTRTWSIGFPGQAGAETNYKSYDEIFAKVARK